jgi:hypothetical protein
MADENCWIYAAVVPRGYGVANPAEKKRKTHPTHSNDLLTDISRFDRCTQHQQPLDLLLQNLTAKYALDALNSLQLEEPEAASPPHPLNPLSSAKMNIAQPVVVAASPSRKATDSGDKACSVKKLGSAVKASSVKKHHKRRHGENVDTYGLAENQ